MKKFRTISYGFLLIAGLTLMVSLASCEQTTSFFSNSWGKGLVRDPNKLFPKVTAANAQELADATAGDSTAAKALLKKINAALKNPNLSTAERKALQAAGLSAANNSSDIIGLFINSAGKLATITGDENKATALDEAAGILEKAEDVTDTADAIHELFEGSSDYSDIPADDLALAALTLIVAEAQEMGTNLDAATIKGIGNGDAERAAQAHAMLKAAKGGSNIFNGVIDDILDAAEEQVS